jgi:hypothetical protein
MRLRSVLGLAAAAVLAGAAHAQQPASPAQAQPQAQPPKGQLNYYPPALYRMDDVGKTLKLNQDQINRLNAVTEKVQAQYRAQYQKINPVNDAESLLRLQELSRQYHGDWNKAAAEVFDNEQRARYQQLYLQYGGFNSLYDPEVQRRLNLTPEQLKNLREPADWSHLQMQAISSTGTTDPAKSVQMYNEYWKQRQERFNKFLTPEQQRVWREMTGEPYTFRPAFAPKP